MIGQWVWLLIALLAGGILGLLVGFLSGVGAVCTHLARTLDARIDALFDRMDEREQAHRKNGKRSLWESIK